MVEAAGRMICHDERQLVPYRGMLFTAPTTENPRSQDPRIERIFPEYTCYVKLRSLFYQGDLTIGQPFRFLVVAGPFEKESHNYAQVAPFRQLIAGEPSTLCLLTGDDFNYLKDVARGTRSEPILENLTIREDLEHLRELHRRSVRF